MNGIDGLEAKGGEIARDPARLAELVVKAERKDISRFLVWEAGDASSGEARDG